MPTINCQPLQYYSDSAFYFELLQRLKLSKRLILDSARDNRQASKNIHANARFDILCAQPQSWLSIPSDRLESPQSDLSSTLDSMTQWFAQYTLDTTPTLNFIGIAELRPDLDELPFCGGIIASFNYELKHLLHYPHCAVSKTHTNTTDSMPLLSAGFYSWAIIQDHHRQQSYWLSIDNYENAAVRKLRDTIVARSKALAETQHQKHAAPFSITQPIKAVLSYKKYTQHFRRIQKYILEGDCYQINYAQHYRGQYHGEPWQAYKILRKTANAPFSCYWDYDSHQVLCLSPERFLKLEQRAISSEPIKGTRRRDSEPSVDSQLALALAHSAKDRAENLMIVDLLRNDLGRNCTPGSIKVDKLFSVESFNTVHHLISKISGKLQPGCAHLQAFLDCFPGGSITGAPKIRAMQIIAQLEPAARQLYCGSIAYFSSHGKTDSNICIRTFVCHQSNIYTWAGGGIVADSELDKEYAECGYKIDKLINAIQN